jgi:hypothetical protein
MTDHLRDESDLLRLAAEDDPDARRALSKH